VAAYEGWAEIEGKSQASGRRNRSDRPKRKIPQGTAKRFGSLIFGDGGEAPG
jgi:hypothetical protein